MYIQKVDISKFKNIEDVSLGPFTEPSKFSDLICLAGPNGSGKSSLLDIITFALTHRYSWKYYRGRQITDHSFRIKIGLTEPEIATIVASSQALDGQEVEDFLKRNQGYWIFVNSEMWPYEGYSHQLNERVHGLFSIKYANYEHMLGFYVRSDRFFAKKQYDQGNIFNWQKRLTSSHIGTMSYGSSDQQYTDIYEYLIEQRYYYPRDVGNFYLKKQSGDHTVKMPVDPVSPYSDLLGKVFEGYSFEKSDGTIKDLNVVLPSGVVVPFSDLSSGEKEVFFILAFFLRNNVSNSIIVIDEPELHLHPELCRKMLKVMRGLNERNQIICATHNPDLIDEAGKDNSYFIRRLPDMKVECRPASQEDNAVSVLRDMFGFSGYIGVARKILFLEGDNNSADRRTFLNLVPEAMSSVKLVPIGSADMLYKINKAVMAIIGENIGYLDLFYLRDRDYLSDAYLNKHKPSGVDERFFVLSRHEIENYLRDEALISEILRRIYQLDLSEAAVRTDLVSIARGRSAGVLRDMVVARYQEQFQMEDCSIGKHSNDQSVLRVDGSLNGPTLTALKSALVDKVHKVSDGIELRTGDERMMEIFEECLEKVSNVFLGESDEWKSVFPGKELLMAFAKRHSLGAWPGLQNLIIEEMASRPDRVPSELREIFLRVSS